MENIKQQCNQYTIKDLHIGMKKSFIVEITNNIKNKFTDLSGDINPLHIDSGYAKKRGYKDCVIYGMCTASFYSTLAGVYLPGERCLLEECFIQWIKPVYAGDIIKVSGTVSDIDERFNRVTIKAGIYNQNDEKVSRAKIVVGIWGGEN